MTRAAAQRFERLLATLPETPAQDVAQSQGARREAIAGQLQELQDQLAAYEALRASRGAVLDLASLDQLPDALIAARIAQGLTQKQLAGILGVSEQQVQRDEKTRYAHAKLDRLIRVARALQAPIQSRVLLPSAAANVEPCKRSGESAEASM
jgi:DNA-binding XRE family transcriptional regulator